MLPYRARNRQDAQIFFMSWNERRPDDFSQFQPEDMPRFMQWWEASHGATLGFELLASFVKGISTLYLDALTRGGTLPPWVQTLLDIRTTVEFAYEHQLPLINKLNGRLPKIFANPEWVNGYRDRYRALNPAELMEIPPQIREAFKQGYEFSLQWVKKLSDEAREDISLILKAEMIRNFNPDNAVPLLESVLRRDLVSQLQGAPATPEQVTDWLKQANRKTIMKISQRARAISITEAARMANLGILTTLEHEGERLAYVMPHGGACAECIRLVEGRVFEIHVLRDNLFANFGKKKKDWVPALPQHPFCRHSAMRLPIEFRGDSRLLNVPLRGLLLKNYGLSSETAMQSLGLPPQDWDLT